MVENLIEILVLMGALVMLLRACRAVARQGNLDDVKRMIGDGLLSPYVSRGSERRNRPENN